jgi:uracil-DNA glycosylase
MKARLPDCWSRVLSEEMQKPYFQQLQAFVAAERSAAAVYPTEEEVFRAFELTPFQQVRVLLLGQDPYHGEGQAHGLCFSVRRGVRRPPSLVNILKELQDDTGEPLGESGNLELWARQGVMLLNTVLTVRAHQAHSHRGRGWETFTDKVISELNDRSQPLVFVLWGRPAQHKLRLIDGQRHRVIQGAHPSPLSARRGFFGTKPFSRINQMLREWNQPEIEWGLR